MVQLTQDDLLARLGLQTPPLPAEYDAFLDQAIQKILKNDSKSGYRDVYRSASKRNPWQAKPYIRPGVQRNLGSFRTVEDAAKQVLVWMYGGLPTPPTPSKDRNKRNEGRRKRDRRNHGQGSRSHPFRPTPLAPHSALPCSQVESTSAPLRTGRRRRSGRCSHSRSLPGRLRMRSLCSCR